jgi:hypothetical protein
MRYLFRDLNLNLENSWKGIKLEAETGMKRLCELLAIRLRRLSLHCNQDCVVCDASDGQSGFKTTGNPPNNYRPASVRMLAPWLDRK